MSASPNLRQPILPFRLCPYRDTLALSVGLFLIIPVVAGIIFAALWLLGWLSWFLSWSLGVIIATIVAGLALSRNNNSDSDNSGYMMAWLFMTCIISFITYEPLMALSEWSLNLTTSSWEFFMQLYEQSGIVYWSWIPIGSMIIYGTVSLISLWIMKLLDWRPHWGRIRFICPHEGCGHVSSSLVYKCPHCGEAMEKLYPSRYGIFYTSCPNCGTSLNASWLTGRNQYSKTCPDCNKSLNYEGFGAIPESVFVVEGAAQSGKTSFLIQALNLWSKRFESYVHFSDSQQEIGVRLMAEKINEGDFCPPTQRHICPEAYLMHCKKSFHSFLAYFYDTGGIASREIDAGSSELYYNLANGVFLVIDPWTEEGILTAFGRKKKNMRYSKYQFASQDADAIIGRLCSKLERIYPESLSNGFDIPLCVVVTKCDINGLSNAIGADVHFTQSSNKWNAHSKQVEDFLVKHGMYNFVNIVKTRFKKKAFFAVSVLDDARNNQSSVLNLLLWMTCNVK